MIRVNKVIIPAFLIAAFTELAAQDCYVPDESQAIIYKGTLMRVVYPSQGVVECLDLSGVEVSAVNGIGDDEDIQNLRQIILPNRLSSIGQAVFHTPLLEYIDLPNSLKSIGSNTFSLLALKEVNLPSGCVEVDVDAFAQNEIASLSWPDAELHNFSGFRGNKLETLKIPSNVRSLGLFAFSDNPLRAIEFSEGIDTIGWGAFGNFSYEYHHASKLKSAKDTSTYTPLQSLTFPNSLKRISARAFYRARSLKTVMFNEGLVSIGEEAFLSADSVESITFPKSLRSIGSSAFYDCVGLHNIDLNDGITNIAPYAFAGCNLTGTLTIPGSMTTVGSYSFYGAFPQNNEVAVVFAEGVTNIESSAFYVNLYSSNQPVTRLRLQFPRTLRSIGSNAFGGVWLPETELPLVAETGDSLRWDAYLDGELVEEGVRTIGGLNKSGYTAFSRRSYVATVVPHESALPKINASHDVTLFDINGRKIYQGPKDSMPSLSGLFILRQPDGCARLLKL